MAEWRINDDGRVRTMSEEKLRKQLREGHLEGHELARPDGDTDWKPLHDWPIFKEEVAFEGDPAAHARKRMLVALLSHVASFAGVGFLTGWQWWMVPWGLAVAGHAASVLPKVIPEPENRKWAAAIGGGAALMTVGMVLAGEPHPSSFDPFIALMIAIGIASSVFSVMFNVIRRLKGGSTAPTAVPAATAKEVPAAKSDDAFLTELESAFRALQAAAKETGREAEITDVAAIRQAALVLHKRRLGLLPLCDPQMRARLDKEQDEVIAQEEKAEHPMTRDAYRQQALALQQRLDAIDEASAIATRLEARERTLLHQVENLRLQLARAGVDESATPNLSADIARMNRELVAEAEVAQTAQTRSMGPQKQPT